MQIKNVLNQQEEVTLLLFLLRLLYITLCTHFLLLTLTGMVSIIIIYRIAAYLLQFFLFYILLLFLLSTGFETGDVAVAREKYIGEMIIDAVATPHFCRGYAPVIFLG